MLPDVQIRSMIDAGLILHNRFKVLKHLGAGGMGEVYLGEDLEFQQNVAIKRMLIEQDEMDKELFDRRFREEVNILRRLKCSGIPLFVDAFSEDGHSFLVMEFIQGYSLDRLLRVSSLQNEGLSPEQVTTVALEVSRVLEYLHSQTPPLVHRDIKPSNLIIRESDQKIFLVDFGLAREVHSKSSAKTQVGTWNYAPIEQIRGWVEPRSDFYSLGVTMLELLSGEVPAALAVPAARKLMPLLNEELAQVIDRCTRAEVTQRYPEAILLRQDLESALNSMNNPSAASKYSFVSRDETIAELVRQWGQGRSPLPPPSLARGSGPVPWGARPEVRAAVDRARRRLLLLSPVVRRVRQFLTLLLIMAAMAFAWSTYQNKLQRAQATAFLPGATWKALNARDLLPTGISRNGGALFTRSESMAVHELTFQFKAGKGKFELLVFTGPYGLRLAPSGKIYQAELVQLTPKNNLDMPELQVLGPRVNTASNSTLSLSSRKNLLVLVKDGRDVARYTVPASDSEWRSNLTGVLQRSESNGPQNTITSLQVR
jgi:serine/threonine protein kinase